MADGGAIVLFCDACDVQFGHNFDIYRDHMKEHDAPGLCHACAKPCTNGIEMAEHVWREHLTVRSVNECFYFCI